MEAGPGPQLSTSWRIGRPLFDARIDIARIATADLPDDAKRRILGLNAIELPGLDL